MNSQSDAEAIAIYRLSKDLYETALADGDVYARCVELGYGNRADVWAAHIARMVAHK